MQVQIDPPVADTVPFQELVPGDFFRGDSWPNGGQFLYKGDYTSDDGQHYRHSYVIKTMGRCDGNINGSRPGEVGTYNIEKLQDIEVIRLKVMSIRFAEVGT